MTPILIFDANQNTSNMTWTTHKTKIRFKKRHSNKICCTFFRIWILFQYGMIWHPSNIWIPKITYTNETFTFIKPTLFVLHMIYVLSTYINFPYQVGVIKYLINILWCQLNLYYLHTLKWALWPPKVLRLLSSCW